jgi:hypothetical protein
MKSINILGVEYRVIIEDNLESLQENLGCVDLDHQIIYIRKDMSDSMIKSTLLHEVIEAINYQLELKMPHRVICGIEAGIFDVISCNSNGLFDSLLEEEEELEI